MKPSKGLQYQLDKLSNIGSFRLTTVQKNELKDILEFNSLHPLTNLSCGTCVRKSLHDLNSFYKRKESIPVLQMSMDKKPTEMNYKELRAACKAKQIKTGKNPTKINLIKLLSNEA
tara:strand:+ start:6298 stop:6645 length:348 start_codon:yes stop_codon:yes gene_type:complete